MRDRRSVVRSTKALHEVRHEVRGPDAYMGFLHEVYARTKDQNRRTGKFR